MSKSHLALWSIQLFKLNQEDVALLKEPHRWGIPPFCLDEKGHIIDSECYYQFITKDCHNKDTEYLYFFYSNPIDTILSHESDNCGIEILFEKIDMRPVFDQLKSLSVNDIHSTLHVSQYIVVEMNYVGGTYPDYDYDLDIKIVGFLNEEMNLQHLVL